MSLTKPCFKFKSRDVSLYVNYLSEVADVYVIADLTSEPFTCKTDTRLGGKAGHHKLKLSAADPSRRV